VRYWNTKRQGFLPECEGVFIEQCLWIPELRIFYGFCAKGHPPAQAKFPNAFEKNNACSCKHEEIITIQA
jgi:hypothetical protein